MNIVISGGSRGLGLALCRDLLARGNRIFTFSRVKSDAIGELEKKYGEDFYYQSLDLLKEEEVQNFIKDIKKEYKSVDALINNAGIAPEGLLAMTSSKNIDQCLGINLRGTLLLSKACARLFVYQKRGVILSISSIHSMKGQKGISLYSATKGAIDALTRSLAKELGSRNIRVNSIAPGYLETDMTKHLDESFKYRILEETPLGRLGNPDDITGLVRFLISDDARFITGQSFVVDGGMSC